MAIRDGTKFTVEYGIQTPTSKTILVVTEDLEEAQRTLDMIGDGRLIQRRQLQPVGRGGRAGANFRLSPVRSHPASADRRDWGTRVQRCVACAVH
jgi:hypothetical protein